MSTKTASRPATQFKKPGQLKTTMPTLVSQKSSSPSKGSKKRTHEEVEDDVPPSGTPKLQRIKQEPGVSKQKVKQEVESPKKRSKTESIQHAKPVASKPKAKRPAKETPSKSPKKERKHIKEESEAEFEEPKKFKIGKEKGQKIAPSKPQCHIVEVEMTAIEKNQFVEVETENGIVNSCANKASQEESMKIFINFLTNSVFRLWRKINKAIKDNGGYLRVAWVVQKKKIFHDLDAAWLTDMPEKVQQPSKIFNI
jgi:hypothetical protein